MKNYRVIFNNIQTKDVKSYFFKSQYSSSAIFTAFDSVMNKYTSFNTDYIRTQIIQELMDIPIWEFIQEPQYYTVFDKEYGYKSEEIIITLQHITAKNPIHEDDRFSDEVNKWYQEYVVTSCGGVNQFYAYSVYNFDKIPIQLLVDIQKEYGCNYFSISSTKNGDTIRMWREIE